MGVKAATFLRGRLLMHGAPGDTPVTAVESVGRPDQRVHATTLIELPSLLAAAAPKGPVIILYGLAPRAAAASLAQIREAL
jgi:uroporphyrin-III C-methyltransferase/precorrin-2 dehydrogenase/sirohydrochlorin ferrochelatase